MAKLVINNLVDWGKSFVDPEGNFYCGTTEDQKDVAAKIATNANKWVYLTDVHTRSSSEFSVNGGLYPVHNLIRRDWKNLSELGVEEEKSVSPELTDKLQEVVKDKPAGLIVPRHVFFQDYDGSRIAPAFRFEEVEQTFNVRKLNPEEFLDGAIAYVINAKHLFDGSAIQPTEWIGYVPGVPSLETNIFTLLKEKYGQGERIVFNHTGVVMGICIYQTASGIKQKFPKAEVNIIADGATHLLVPTLGFGDQKTADAAIQSMCKQVGINYIRSGEFLGNGR